MFDRKGRGMTETDSFRFPAELEPAGRRNYYKLRYTAPNGKHEGIFKCLERSGRQIMKGVAEIGISTLSAAIEQNGNGTEIILYD